MIPETDYPQESKRVYPGKPAPHARLIRVDSLRNVYTVGFLARRLKYNGGLFSLNMYFLLSLGRLPKVRMDVDRTLARNHNHRIESTHRYHYSVVCTYRGYLLFNLFNHEQQHIQQTTMKTTRQILDTFL